MSNLKLDLTQWKVFVDVADAGSLTRAAITRGTVQPSVSRQISALERECGGALFHRTGRGLTLTELGLRTYPRVKELLTLSENVVDEVQQAVASPGGSVHVGLLSSFIPNIVGPLIQHLREHYPRIKLHFLDGSNRQLDEWLAQGKLDMAVLFADARYLEHETHIIARANICLVGRKDDPVTRESQVDFRRLDGLPLVLPAHPNGLRTRLENVASEQAIKLAVVAEAEALQILKDIVASGAAHTVLIEQAVRWEVESGRLQAARLVNPNMHRSITVAMSNARPATRAAREVLKETLSILNAQVRKGMWSSPPH